MVALEQKRSIRVLVVDDSKMVRSISRKRLASVGYDVMLATDGYDAISSIVEHRPDIVLMDVMMPGIDGYETCELLKAHRLYSAIPLIMLSGNDRESDRQKGFEAGFDHCLAKPVDENELNAIIGKLLSSN